jgi:hypothetical protein
VIVRLIVSPRAEHHIDPRFVLRMSVARRIVDRVGVPILKDESRDVLVLANDALRRDLELAGTYEASRR